MAASGPPAVLRLIAELGRLGTTRVLPPACAGCGRVVRLGAVHDGQRICAACSQRLRGEPCAGCGAVRAPAIRDAAGRPRCSRCQQADPANLEACAGCGRRRPVVRRTTRGPLCHACYRAPVAVCSGCGRTRPCHRIRSGVPRCERCSRRVEACARCGRTAPVMARAAEGPLCAAGYATDPRAKRPCQACGALERRYAQGRCVLDQRLRALLGDARGVVGAELELVHRTLAATDPPRAGLKWLARSSAAAVLADLGAGARPLSHQALDELLPDKAVDHLRHILVAAGCLPARDERLTRLERWLAQTVATIADPDDQRVVHTFAVWHLLGRLRRRLDAEQRWATARRLLSDTDLDPADRVAALLVLCYAQPVTTIARLTLDRITHDPGGVHLLLGSTPALLPEPLADLVLELAAARKGHATVGSPATSPWLLPGGTPGRPIGADRLAIRLGRLGVPARPGRAAALTDLAAQLPVGVLARLLGVSPGAASSWRTSAGGTWSGYAAELAQRGQPHQPDAPWGDLPR